MQGLTGFQKAAAPLAGPPNLGEAAAVLTAATAAAAAAEEDRQAVVQVSAAAAAAVTMSDQLATAEPVEPLAAL